MYIHTLRGRHAPRSRYDDTSANDRYIAGYVGILDRLAIWRLTGKRYNTVAIQNVVLAVVQAAAATGAIVWLAHSSVFQTDTRGATPAQVMTVIGCIVIGIGTATFYIYDLFQILEHDRGPTVWLSEAVLARPRLFSRIMFVDKARALRAVVKGSGNAADNPQQDRLTIRDTLDSWKHSQRAIDSFLQNKWVREAERLIDARPENPSDEDKAIVESIKAQLDARAQVVREVCQARVDRDNGVTIARSQAQVDSWRQSATKFVAAPRR